MPRLSAKSPKIHIYFLLAVTPSKHECRWYDMKLLSFRAGKFHGISSLLNLVGLGAAVGHGWWLASRLSMSLM